MRHITGESRYQSTLLPPSLDELVGAEHPVRVINAFIDTQDLKALGFASVELAETGRPSYSPSDLLKLYVYGYLNQVRSSRRLEKECTRNVELMWLLDRVSPCFKTIAAFRSKNAKAIKQVCREFTRFCRDVGLLASRVVAIDGTKLGAVASRSRVLSAKQLAKEEAALEKRIGAYLSALNEADKAEAGQAELSGTAEAIEAALQRLREKKEEVRAQAAHLKAMKVEQQVVGEEEARLMRTAHGHAVSYNGQIAVDSEHHLIVHAELTNEGNDQCQLQPMAEGAKAALDVDALTVVADTGYSNGEQGHRCVEAGLTPMVPRPRVVNARDEESFTRERFAYDAQTDTYTCPAGERLARKRQSQKDRNAQYWNKQACAGCPLKGRCTKSGYRVIVRSDHEADKEAMHQRAQSDPQWMRLRRSRVEHPFGTIKWLMGTPRFLVRGLEKAGAEFALGVLAYNLKRVIAISGVTMILAQLKAWRWQAAPAAAG